ncbi:MAG: hypothetical protein WC973_03065 [Candidatus Dojkabacteria bacterium]
MSKYTNKANVEAYLGRELTTSESTLLDGIIEYLSQFINSYTNRVWTDISGNDPEPSSNIYDGNGMKEVRLNDSVKEITKVEILDTSGGVYSTLLPADIITYPLNREIVESIVLRNYTFPNRRASIKVYGIFTDGDVPTDVISVCTGLVGRYINHAITNGGFKKESIEGYSYELLSSDEQNIELRNLVSTLDMRKKILL